MSLTALHKSFMGKQLLSYLAVYNIAARRCFDYKICIAPEILIDDSSLSSAPWSCV